MSELIYNYPNYKLIGNHLYLYDVHISDTELNEIIKKYLYKIILDIYMIIRIDYKSPILTLTLKNNQMIIPKDYEYPLQVPRKPSTYYTASGMTRLGSGLYGSVYKSGNYAIKIFENLSKYGNPYLDNTYLRETATLLRLSHSNIIQLIDIITINTEVAIVLPLASMNLLEFINKYNYDKKFVVYELIKGYAYLQNKDIIHADVKLDNVLVFIDSSNNVSIKLSDFGLAVHSSCYPSKLVDRAYNVYLKPIEILLSLELVLPSDIWALAGIIFIVYTKEYLFYDKSDDAKQLEINKIIDPIERNNESYKYERELYSKILSRIINIFGNPLDDWPELINMISDEYINLFNTATKNLDILKNKIKDDGMFDILIKMMKYNPYDRINLNELLFDDYFKDVNGYPATVDVVQCGIVVDKRQKYIKNIDNDKSREMSLDIISRNINKFKLDPIDYFYISYVYDHTHNIRIKPENVVNFVHGCLTVWTLFKYNNIYILENSDKWSINNKLAWEQIKIYSEMIINILQNDLIFTTLGDYLQESGRSLFDLCIQSVEKGNVSEYLPKEIYTSLKLYDENRDEVERLLVLLSNSDRKGTFGE